MLLLPDQTYEQCQEPLINPLIALKRLINDAHSTPKIDTRPTGKSPFREQWIDRSDCDDSTTATTSLSHGSDEANGRAESPASYAQTTEFFNNIPEFNGQPLGPFSIPQARDHVKTTADLLKECEQFLYRYRIRPDFFCRYRKAMNQSNNRSLSNQMSCKQKTSEARKSNETRKSSSIPLSPDGQMDHMERFEKFAAIYTLPIRPTKRTEKQTQQQSPQQSPQSQQKDASSSNEAVHLQQRLKSLGSELVTLRNRLHVSQRPADVNAIDGSIESTAGCKVAIANIITSASNRIASTGQFSAANVQLMSATQSKSVTDHKINTKAAADNLSQDIHTMPIISPRNMSIPHPLPLHVQSKPNDGHVNSATLPRRTTADVDTSTRTKVFAPTRIITATHSVESTDMEDLIHLPGPLTEDAVMRTLQARFKDGKNFTNIGPILLSINPYADVGNPLTLSSTRTLKLAPQLRRIVMEAVRQQAETGYPQAIILSGTSGAGKTHCSMLLLRQLFAVAGGGPETDAFKHLAAAFTVLRSLGSAKTATNSESSRIGQFIEVQVTDGALYRTKIHCYFLDQTRVIRPLPNEKSYHIFYQMLAGLSRDERIKLNLEGYSATNLRYLQGGDVYQDEKEDAARFQAWKTCLGILGIPFLDVVRVLAAVLLLGNVQFMDGQRLEVDIKGEPELNSVACLLGVSPTALFRGLTTRTHNARGQLIKSVCDANMSNMTRDSLAKALYCRTVATIVRRANSLKRLGSTLGTLSSDSNESVHNQADIASQHASTIGGNSGSKSMAALNNAVRHATDGFIGILDMFGFEEPKPAHLEHLCINLCAETMQHFYNTHIFKSSVESCRDEGIMCETDVDYVDNVPCIDLISSLRTGLLSMLDTECAVRGTAESYVTKIKVQHRSSSRLEIKQAELQDPRMFSIRHFAGRVEYDTTDFLDTNRDVVSDDLVSVFYKHTCNFGFATHLFGSELKALYALENVPRGLSFRIAPTSHTDLLNGDEPVSTLTQDFHTRLDNLLRTLVHARPHFVRCIRSNANERNNTFERQTIVKQIRSLQILETVNLMASGYPHRMRFKLFAARYRMLAPFRLLRRNDDKALEDCKLILENALETPSETNGTVTLSWAPGKRHVFLSEGIRQHLEKLRSEMRANSAATIQAAWRGYSLRRRIGSIKRSRDTGNNNVNANTHNTQTTVTAAKTTTTTAPRPRPQPIAGTPPPDPNEKCDSKTILQTCNLFGLDLERPPPVPPSRSYTVTGNSKLGYPQTRIMKMNFPEYSALTTGTEQLRKGETVTVVGASYRRGHLIVEQNGVNFHVPFQYMELVKNTTPVNI